MKAIYQTPVTDILFIHTAPLMTGSQLLPEKVEDGFDPTTAPTTEETSGNLSRRYSNVWEDEELEDEE